MPTMANILRGKSPQVTYRAQILPYAEYDDGSVGFSYPQIAPDTWDAILKMGRAGMSALGAQYAPQDVMPTAQDAGLIAGLAMTGGIGAGLAGRSAGRAAAAKATQDRTDFLLSNWNNPQGRVLRGPNGLELVEAFDGVYRIRRNGQPIGDVSVSVNGNIANIRAINAEGGPNSLGLSGIRDLREAFRQAYPGVTEFTSGPGGRVSGARAGPAAAPNNKTQKVTLFSNAPDAAPVGLLAMSNLERMQADDLLPRPRPEPAPAQFADVDAEMLAQRGQRGRWVPAEDMGNLDLRRIPKVRASESAPYDAAVDAFWRRSAGPDKLNANPASPAALLPMGGEGEQQYPTMADLLRMTR